MVSQSHLSSDHFVPTTQPSSMTVATIAESPPTADNVVAHTNTRIACWLLIICNSVTRGTIGVAETFGAEIFTFVLGPDTDTVPFLTHTCLHHSCLTLTLNGSLPSCGHSNQMLVNSFWLLVQLA
jgi:hypothetical protein